MLPTQAEPRSREDIILINLTLNNHYEHNMHLIKQKCSGLHAKLRKPIQNSAI